MSNTSGIEWTEATWNPTTGCSKISTGCKNCYAESMSKRLKAMGVKKYKNNFKFTEHISDVEIPLTWKKPKKIFVNSMSDLFHEKSDFTFVGKCFETMIQANWHTYQVLTKRPKKMIEFSNLFKKFYKSKIPSHIWMGTSIENEDFIWRIKELRKVQCEMRFISFEPLLGPVGEVNLEGIDWAIIGGESGHKFRKVREEWVWDIIKQCKKQKVPVFFKQWGGIRPKSGGRTIKNKIFDQYPKTKNPTMKKILLNA